MTFVDNSSVDLSSARRPALFNNSQYDSDDVDPLLHIRQSYLEATLHSMMTVKQITTQKRWKDRREKPRAFKLIPLVAPTVLGV